MIDSSLRPDISSIPHLIQPETTNPHLRGDVFALQWWNRLNESGHRDQMDVISHLRDSHSKTVDYSRYPDITPTVIEQYDRPLIAFPDRNFGLVSLALGWQFAKQENGNLTIPYLRFTPEGQLDLNRSRLVSLNPQEASIARTASSCVVFSS